MEIQKYKPKLQFLRRMRRVFHIPFLALLGPGLIAAAAGNDAGGIATYSIAGADFGYRLLWLMVPLTAGLIIVQEMSARLGVVTGKGFSDLIRENFNLKTTVFLMGILTLANASLVISEFAGVAASFELFGISKYVSVPITAFFLWWLIVKGTYPKAEKLFIIMSALLISYVPAAFLAHANWVHIGIELFHPTIPATFPQMSVAIALLGTTISPYMQLFAQSSVVEKGITISNYNAERIDTIVGVVFSNLIAIFIIVAAAETLYPAQVNIENAKTAALALQPFAGSWATILFGVGFLGASLLAAGVLPLTTAFALCNAFGWESGVNRSLTEAPIFYAIFTFLIVLSATIVLSPAISLIELLYKLQILNAIILPVELFFMVKLINNHQLMGKYVNGKLYNLLVWACVLVIGGVSFIYMGSTLFNFITSFFKLT